jgi:hypothetical protein
MTDGKETIARHPRTPVDTRPHAFASKIGEVQLPPQKV